MLISVSINAYGNLLTRISFGSPKRQLCKGTFVIFHKYNLSIFVVLFLNITNTKVHSHVVQTNAPAAVVTNPLHYGSETVPVD